MYPDLLVFLRELLPNLPLSVTTNGYFLDEKMVKLLNENNIIVTILSCDGIYHDEHRKDILGKPTLWRVKRQWDLLPDYKYEKTTLRGTWLPNQRLVEMFRFVQREFGTLNFT